MLGPFLNSAGVSPKGHYLLIWSSIHIYGEQNESVVLKTFIIINGLSINQILHINEVQSGIWIVQNCPQSYI